MEAVYKNSKNDATFSSSFNGRNSSHDNLYAAPFHLSFSSSSSSPYPNPRDSQQNQPPLLPLPHQNNRRKKINNNMSNQQSLSVRKPSSSGRERFKHQPVSSNNRLGPDPMDVPKFMFSSSSGVRKSDQVTKFSGSIVSTVLSPPPSSLPLPTFSLRPKLSCNAEVAGVDAGATDSLRRILRIR